MKNANPLLLILSVLIPIVGFILFFAKKDDNADAAGVYLWGAIAGLIIGLLMIL